METVLVSHVVEMAVGVLVAVVVAHQFVMEIVPLLVVLSMDQLLRYKQQLRYP